MKTSYTVLLWIMLIFTAHTGMAESDWIVDPVSDSGAEDYLKNNAFATGPDGTYHVVFRRQLEGGFIGPGPGQAWYTYKNPGGEWSSPELVSPDDDNLYIYYPTIAVINDGSVYIAYEQDDGSATDIVLAWQDEGEWNRETIPAEGIENTKPALVSDEDGNLHIVWNSMNAEWEVHVEYATNMTGEWETQIIPGTENWDDSNPEITLTPEGVAHVLVIDADDDAYVMSNDMPGGDDWSSSLLETNKNFSTSGRVQYLDHTLHVVVSGKDDWQDPDDDIFYFEKSDGEWTDGTQLTDEFKGQVISLLADDAGNITVAGLETEQYMDYGTVFIIEKTAGDVIEAIFEVTEDVDVLNATIAYDWYNNLCVIYNEEVGYNNANIYMAHQGVPTFAVTFDVQNEAGDPVADASITLGDHDNEEGDYAFMDIEYGTYDYTIQAPGYFQEEGTVDIHEDKEINIILSLEVYSIFFEVEGESGVTVNDAIITLNGQSNDPGDYEFSGIEPGTYTYSIEAENFHPAEGECTLENEDVLLTVTLENDETSIGEGPEKLLQVFPNPARDHVTIASESLIDKVEIFDMNGRIIKRIKPNAKQPDVDVSDLTPGIYFMQISTQHEQSMIKLQRL